MSAALICGVRQHPQGAQSSTAPPPQGQTSSTGGNGSRQANRITQAAPAIRQHVGDLRAIAWPGRPALRHRADRAPAHPRLRAGRLRDPAIHTGGHAQLNFPGVLRTRPSLGDIARAPPAPSTPTPARMLTEVQVEQPRRQTHSRHVRRRHVSARVPGAVTAPLLDLPGMPVSDAATIPRRAGRSSKDGKIQHRSPIVDGPRLRFSVIEVLNGILRSRRPRL